MLYWWIDFCFMDREKNYQISRSNCYVFLLSIFQGFYTDLKLIPYIVLLLNTTSIKHNPEHLYYIVIRLKGNIIIFELFCISISNIFDIIYS